MKATFLSSALGLMPHVARRDRRIRVLEGRLKQWRQLAEHSFQVPSFRRYIYAERRIASHLRDLGSVDRGHVVTNKLKSYAFARSHGVDVPEIYGIWNRPEDIAWDELPDAVVIKTARGTGGRGVTPLRRTADGWTKVSTADTTTSAEVVDRLKELRESDHGRGPYFAEELLDAGVRNSLPVDVKVHAFYGEVSHVLLRRVATHGDPKSSTFRVILPDGTDAGPVLRGLVHDHDIPVPADLDAFMEVGRTISLAIPRPFIRVDLYDIDGQVVFGELTPRPGSIMDYGREQDERLGHLWERAQARVTDDALNGSSPTMRFGAGPRELIVGGRPMVPGGAG